MLTFAFSRQVSLLEIFTFLKLFLRKSLSTCDTSGAIGDAWAWCTATSECTWLGLRRQDYYIWVSWQKDHILNCVRSWSLTTEFVISSNFPPVKQAWIHKILMIFLQDPSYLKQEDYLWSPFLGKCICALYTQTLSRMKFLLYFAMKKQYMGMF